MPVFEDAWAKPPNTWTTRRAEWALANGANRLVNATDDPAEMAWCDRLGFVRDGLAMDGMRFEFRLAAAESLKRWGVTVG